MYYILSLGVDILRLLASDGDKGSLGSLGELSIATRLCENWMVLRSVTFSLKSKFSGALGSLKNQIKFSKQLDL